MSNPLGYGGAELLRMQVQNTGTTTISRGKAVSLESTTDISGAGDSVTEAGSTVLQVKETVTGTVKAILGVAQADIGPNEYGHVVILGYAQVLAGGTIAAGDAITPSAAFSTFTKAAGADITANNGVGKALSAAASGALFGAFVNFTHAIDANTGYGGAES